jgi:hypothetical protein
MELDRTCLDRRYTDDRDQLQPRQSQHLGVAAMTPGGFCYEIDPSPIDCCFVVNILKRVPCNGGFCNIQVIATADYHAMLVISGPAPPAYSSLDISEFVNCEYQQPACINGQCIYNPQELVSGCPNYVVPPGAERTCQLVDP